MKKLNRLAPYLLCVSFLTTMLYADISAEAGDLERVPVGERVATPKEVEEMDQQREQLAALEQDEEPLEANCDNESNSLTAKGMQAEHAGAYQQPYAIDYEFGSQVELIDGSVWAIRGGSSRSKVRSWSSGDIIFVVPNSANSPDILGFTYNLKLRNIAKDTTAEAELVLGPFYNGAKTFWIVKIDPILRKIMLNDGSLWTVSIWDKPEILRWWVNDTVILGVNTGISSWFNSSILVNVATKDYVKANRNI